MCVYRTFIWSYGRIFLMNTYEDLLKEYISSPNKKNRSAHKNYFTYKAKKIKNSGKSRNIKTAISEEYIKSIFPRDFKCPVLKKSFDFNDKDLIPSLDRVFNDKGYEVGNVIWVSRKVNIVKSNADSELILKITNYYEKLLNE